MNAVPARFAEPVLGSHLPNETLLRKLLGARAARRLGAASLSQVFGAEQQDERCVAARELVRRWLREELTARPVLSAPNAVKDFLRLQFRDQGHESFVVLFLDAQNRLIASEEMFRGTLTQTSVYPREVVKRTLHHNAAAVIVAHNHPSGVAEPSIQDQSLTRTLSEALAMVDVKVLDHFVIAGPNTVSFAERGMV